MYNATMLSWLEITPSAKRKHSNLPLSNVRYFGATTTMCVNPFFKYLRLLTPFFNNRKNTPRITSREKTVSRKFLRLLSGRVKLMRKSSRNGRSFSTPTK